MYNTNQSHPLVERQQNYVLERRLLSVHSIDRDIAKWPFSNHFEVELPEPLLNVQSMRLAMANMPAVFYNFNNEYQNTKLTFSIKTSLELTSDIANALNDASNQLVRWEIVIPDGFYTPSEIANQIQCMMNQKISDWLQGDPSANGYTYDASWGNPYAPGTIQNPNTVSVTQLGYGPFPGEVYDNFFVLFDSPASKFVFVNDRDNFTIHMGEQRPYNLQQCERKEAFFQWSHWGAGYYLGFDKEDYNAGSISGDYTFCWKPAGSTSMVSPDVSGVVADLSGAVWATKSPHVMKLFGDQLIYMEVDKYNSIDEIYPYTDTTDNLTICNPPKTTKTYVARDCRANLGVKQVKQQSGHIHSAFAKIPAISTPPAEIYVTPNDFTALSYFSPPLERIQKLKFKFRTHDGRLIDFNDYPFNFTIELNCLKPEPARRLSIIVPEVYQLS
jgi:hypothetical protein